MSFYINLLSNKCLGEFPNNNPSDFVNRFQKEISVHPQSEIALSELKIRQQLDQIHCKDAEFDLFDFQEFSFTEHSQKKYGKWVTCKLDSKCYKNATELCGCLNLLIYKNILRLRKTKPKIFYYDESMDRIWCNVKEKYDILILLKKSLLVLLGAEDISRVTRQDYLSLGKSKREKGYKTADGKIRFFDKENCNKEYRVHPTTKGLNYFALPPFFRHINEILVHVSIVDPQIIADKRNERVIKFIPVNSKFNGHSVVYSFAGSRCYMDLAVTNFIEIGIKLTDIDNQPLPLLADTRLQLHEKRKI